MRSLAGVWPLVGRTDEIDRALVSLSSNKGAVLSGLPGVGKSRLASELLQVSASRGWATVELSAGPETAAAPFSPFTPLLDGGGREEDPVSRFLRAERALTAPGERVVVAIDDAHLLDDVSVAFVRHLVTATEVRLLLTIRSGVPVPSTIVTLWQAGHLDRIEVQALARGEVERLVELALPGAVEHRTLAWVWETTHGNPLFTHELVLDAVERGALVERDGRWTLTKDARGAGSRLQEVVAARVGSLSTEEREAVELVALAEPMSLTMLEELVGAEVVRRLDGRGLLAGHSDRRRPAARLAHPLHGETARATMGLTAGRDHRRRLIAAFLETGARRALDRQRIALWRCEVGDLADWESLLSAARELAMAGDRSLVAALGGNDVDGIEPTHTHLERAATLARGALDGGRSVAAAAVLFGLLRRLGRDDEASAVLAEAERLAETEADTLELVRMRATEMVFGRDISGAPEAARAFIEGVGAPDVRIAGSASLAAMTAMTGRYEEALDLARTVLADDAADESDRALGAAVAAVGLAEAGLVTEALAHVAVVAAAIEVDRRTDLVVPLALIHCNLLAVGGRLDEAEELIGSCYAAADRLDDDASRGLFAVLAALVAMERGQPGRAVVLADEAVERLAGVDQYGLRRAALCTRAHAHALLGDEEAMGAALRVLDADDALGVSRSEELRARAWCDVASGRIAVALGRLEANIEVQAAAGCVVREAAALHDLVRLGHPGVAVERLAELAAAADTPVLDLMAAHAAAAAVSGPEGLVSVAERWAELGFHLFAAEAFSQACAAFGTAAARAEAAASRAAAQRGMDAARSRSHRALERCGPVRTPALSSAGPRATLTPREREIAWLAARGRTDKEIAEELVVSVRTVQTHLYNVYAKLGIDGRVALDEALGPA